jgi:hypothetical protein
MFDLIDIQYIIFRDKPITDTVIVQRKCYEMTCTVSAVTCKLPTLSVIS